MEKLKGPNDWFCAVVMKVKNFFPCVDFKNE